MKSKGRVRLFGHAVDELSRQAKAKVRRQIGVVFQDFRLLKDRNIYENIAFGLKLRHLPNEEIHKKVLWAAQVLDLTEYLDRKPRAMSGGQRQRIGIARALIMNPKLIIADEAISALDVSIQAQVVNLMKKIQKETGITTVFVTHDQEEALTLSDRVVVMREGKIQQIGTPTDVYNEPQNCFVADFIGESNILDATMVKDGIVNFCENDFECVDKGFGEDQEVDVVVRPEDVYIGTIKDGGDEKSPWQLHGEVKSCIFKGVHYEMTVLTENGYELMIQDYHAFEVGSQVGLLIKPEDIQVMKKERLCNTFDGEVLEDNQVRFLDEVWDIPERVADRFEVGEEVEVEVDFNRVNLQDDEEDGTLCGEVHFILYKGDHYHLTVRTDEGDDIFVDTNDVWDDGDRVGIRVAPSYIRLYKKSQEQ